MRWTWFILPLSLEALAFALLAHTISATKKRRVPIWKSSATVMLFHDVDQRANADALAAKKISAMDELANKKRVRLVASLSGYRLIEHEPPI